MQITSWWGRLRPRQRSGIALAGLGGVLTILIAWLSSQREPPPGSTQALIAMLALAAQGAAAWLFNSDGRADPGLAVRSVGRLVGMAQRAREARVAAEAMATPGPNASELRQASGVLSVHLSYIEEAFIDAIEDWRVFHPHVVQQAEGTPSTDDE